MKLSKIGTLLKKPTVVSIDLEGERCITKLTSLEELHTHIRRYRESGTKPTTLALEALRFDLRNLNVISKTDVTLESFGQIQAPTLEQLERDIRVSQEGVIDDLTIWVGKVADTVDSKINDSKFYLNLATSIRTNFLPFARKHKNLVDDPDDFKVAVPGKAVRFLAHAEKPSDVLKVWNSYIDSSINVLNGGLSQLEVALKAAIEASLRGEDENKIKEAFFKNVSQFVHIDGSYTAMGRRDTFMNKMRKLLGQTGKWESGTFDDEAYEKVTGVWALPLGDFESAADSFDKFIAAVNKFVKEQPKRRSDMKHMIVNAVKQVGADNKDAATKIAKLKNVFLVVVEIDKEIMKYMWYTLVAMSNYFSVSQEGIAKQLTN